MSTQINAILFDGPERVQLLPFTYIRPVAELRIGIDTLIEKWNAFLNTSCSYATQAYLAPKFPAKPAALNCFINPSYIPTQALVDQIKELQEKQVLLCENKPVACCTSDSVLPQDFSNFEVVVVQEALLHIEKVSDLFSKNAAVLAMDFDRLTHNKVSQPLDNSNRLIHPERIFITPGAQVSCAVLNATDGPIYIGSNAQIMEGSLLRGPIALCDKVLVKMGTKVYGGTTIGPNSKIGGELNNVLFLGNSNKGHDGFLGNAVIGEWGNIGAATDASNLKNNYGNVRICNYETENFAKSALQFCGLLMGDFSRCGIHSMFNTATLIGINTNIFGSGFPRTFIPSFSYGGAQGFQTHAFRKAMESNVAMMKRKGEQLSDLDTAILQTVFELSSVWRKDRSS